MTSDERLQKERELRAQLKDAESEYRLATSEYRRLTEIHRDIGVTPDGDLALRRATGLLRDATGRYNAALKAFSDFSRNNPAVAWLILDKTAACCESGARLAQQYDLALQEQSDLNARLKRARAERDHGSARRIEGALATIGARLYDLRRARSRHAATHGSGDCV